jgi:hypothetical protein
MMSAIEMPSCGMKFLPSFMKSGTGIQAILRFCLSSLKGSSVGNTEGSDLWSMLLRWLHAV